MLTATASTLGDRGYEIDIPKKMLANLKYQLESFDLMNKYDVQQTEKKYMIEENIKKENTRKLKPIKTQLKIWKKNLDNCLEHKKYAELELIEKNKEKMLEKKKKVDSLLTQNKNEKDMKVMEKKSKLRESIEKIKRKLSDHEKELEQERLQTEVKIYRKLRERSKRQINKMDWVRTEFHRRNVETEKKYETCLKIKENNHITKQKKLEEIKFENFSNWLFNKIAREKKSEVKMRKDKQKKFKQNCLYIQEEHENKRNELIEETVKKLEDAEIARKKHEEKRKKMAEEKGLIIRQKLHAAKANKRSLTKKSNEKSMTELGKQMNLLIRSNEKQNIESWKKFNIQ